HVVLNCSGDNSRSRWRLGLPGCKYNDEGNGVELKSSDEELARGTISESRVGEPRNPISVLFYDRRGRQREGAVFSGLLCSPIQDVAQRLRKDDGNAKASMQTAGAKQCYAFVIVRIKGIDISLEEETSVRRNISRKKEPEGGAEWMKK
ncbi:hypothetical protein ALC57_07757, partial [Trachymyrmex cornetzi]